MSERRTLFIGREREINVIALHASVDVSAGRAKTRRARSANNNLTEKLIAVIIGNNFPSLVYSPTSARITVSNGAIGNRTATLNSSI